MKFVSFSDQIVVSLTGHSVLFKSGVPTMVPPEMHKELGAKGIVDASTISESVLAALTAAAPAAPGSGETPADLVGAQSAGVVAGTEPTDPDERAAAFTEAFKKLALEGNRENYLPNGVPHTKPLAAALGFRVTAAERDDAWAKFQAVPT